jgi:hypothetical protein
MEKELSGTLASGSSSLQPINKETTKNMLFKKRQLDCKNFILLMFYDQRKKQSIPNCKSPPMFCKSFVLDSQALGKHRAK